jgi:CDP-glucose 4,6-dehydratase
VVFHLAAQALVRESYRDPLGTYSTNVMGTANVLRAAGSVSSVRSVVVVTSDKCYEESQGLRGHAETDRLGGADPYSSSKACAELVAAAWRRSFLQPTAGAPRPVLATARAGNVIGGGDFAPDRIVPDCVRALSADRELELRYPAAVRPWQFVLEPLRGYLMLAERCCAAGAAYGEAWNFGPGTEGARPVAWLVQRFAELTGGRLRYRVSTEPNPHETTYLALDCAKAAGRLAWRPVLDVEETLAQTAAWYRAWLEGRDLRPVTMQQLEQYEQRCATAGG